MSLLEWLGEAYSPGSTGGGSIGSRDRDPHPRWLVILFAILALAMLAGWGYLIWEVMQLRTLQSIGWAGLATFAYLIVGYFVHLEPDPENVGWLGGLMDDPFRYSDDINRFGFLIVVLLWPGRFVAEALIDLLYLVVDWFHGHAVD